MISDQINKKNNKSINSSVFFIFLFFLCCFIENILSFNVSIDKIVKNDDDHSVKIICSYFAEEYILADSIKSSAMPDDEFLSVVFEQTHELFIPKLIKPIHVIHGEGVFVLEGKNLYGTVNGALIYYTDYNINKRLNNEQKMIYVYEKDKLENNKVKEDKISCAFDEKNENKDHDSIKTFIKESKGEIEVGKIENNYKKTVSGYLIDKLNNLNNFPIIILLIFILGIILSFTPCIYPMIPVTLGILGVSEKKTLGQRIFRAALYVLGIATTFSILGFLAVSGKIFFGALLANEYFIFFMLLFFLYMVLSMFDLCQIKDISGLNFFKKIDHFIFSPFFYGMLSGTIFSPCVSPGLFALLTFVGDQESYFYAILFLFIFGVGLGTPLFVISIGVQNSMMLPKADSWMVTVKYIIGLVLFYFWTTYAQLVFPVSYVFAFAIVFLFFLSFFKIDFLKQKHAKVFLFFLIVLQGYFFYKLIDNFIRSKNLNSSEKSDSYFTEDYYEAISIAKNSNKILLIDASAKWCSYCNKVTEKFFNQDDFMESIVDYAVPYFLDFTNESNVKKNQEIIDRFNINYLPDILIVNPIDEKIIKRYDSSVMSLSKEDFANEIIKCCSFEE